MNERLAEIQELLPFWVNGTLDDDERARVAAALAESSDLRAEEQALRDLRGQIKATPRPNSPGELGLARLMRTLAQEPVAAPVAAPALGRARISGMLAATAAVAAVLSSLLTVALQGNDGPVYEQASGDSGDIVLTVSFQPEATEGAISALLREKGLIIVEGPPALGLYRLAVPFDTPLDEATAYLGEATEIIAMVEGSE